jgi:uncharacterized membrane protein YfcA
VLVGYYLRLKLLPDPKTFKLFVGFVLLYVGYRLVKGVGREKPIHPPGAKDDFHICNLDASLRTISFSLMGERIRFSVLAVGLPALATGIVSGIYGIGGGALMAPFLITILHIPVYAAAGAVLLANFATSFAGVLVYSTLPLERGYSVPPDWLLGSLFGFGGLLGMYLGAKLQRYMPARLIKGILFMTIITISVKYILQYF